MDDSPGKNGRVADAGVAYVGSDVNFDWVYGSRSKRNFPKDQDELAAVLQ